MVRTKKIKIFFFQIYHSKKITRMSLSGEQYTSGVNESTRTKKWVQMIKVLHCMCDEAIGCATERLHAALYIAVGGVYQYS